MFYKIIKSIINENLINDFLTSYKKKYGNPTSEHEAIIKKIDDAFSNSSFSNPSINVLFYKFLLLDKNPTDLIFEVLDKVIECSDIMHKLKKPLYSYTTKYDRTGSVIGMSGLEELDDDLSVLVSTHKTDLYISKQFTSENKSAYKRMGSEMKKTFRKMLDDLLNNKNKKQLETFLSKNHEELGGLGEPEHLYDRIKGFYDVFFGDYEKTVRDKIKTLADKKDYHILYDDNGLLFILIVSSKASKVLGCGSNWCISRGDDDLDADNSYFNDTYGTYLKHFIFDFNKNPEDNLSLLGLDVNTFMHSDFNAMDKFNHDMDVVGYIKNTYGVDLYKYAVLDEDVLESMGIYATSITSLTKIKRYDDKMKFVNRILKKTIQNGGDVLSKLEEIKFDLYFDYRDILGFYPVLYKKLMVLEPEVFNLDESDLGLHGVIKENGEFDEDKIGAKIFDGGVYNRDTSDFILNMVYAVKLGFAKKLDFYVLADRIKYPYKFQMNIEQVYSECPTILSDKNIHIPFDYLSDEQIKEKITKYPKTVTERDIISLKTVGLQSLMYQFSELYDLSIYGIGYQWPKVRFVSENFRRKEVFVVYDMLKKGLKNKKVFDLIRTFGADDMLSFFRINPKFNSFKKFGIDYEWPVRTWNNEYVIQNIDSLDREDFKEYLESSYKNGGGSYDMIFQLDNLLQNLEASKTPIWAKKEISTKIEKEIARNKKYLEDMNIPDEDGDYPYIYAEDYNDTEEYLEELKIYRNKFKVGRIYESKKLKSDIKKVLGFI